MQSVTLAAAGRFLTEYGLLGILVSMPPALLLGLGFKLKNRWTLFASGSLFLSLGCTVLGITLDGVTTGEVLALSRSTLMVAQAGHPVFFWVSTAACVAMSLAIAGGGLFVMGVACLPWRNSSGSAQPGTESSR